MDGFVVLTEEARNKAAKAGAHLKTSVCTTTSLGTPVQSHGINSVHLDRANIQTEHQNLGWER